MNECPFVSLSRICFVSDVDMRSVLIVFVMECDLIYEEMKGIFPSQCT
jgi:hypothetical protein